MKLVIGLVLAAAAAAAAILAGGFAAAPYAAVVNGTRISQATLNSDLRAIQDNRPFYAQLKSQGQVSGQGTGTFDSHFAASILSGRISQVLIDQELARRGITLTSEDLKLAEADVVASFASNSGQSSTSSPTEGSQRLFDSFPSYYREHLLASSAALTALEARVANVDISESGMARYYAAHHQNYTLTCVSDIAVSSQSQALGLFAQLGAGADFATLASRSSSVNPGEGGSLGCNPPGTFVSAFQTVVDSLSVGQVASPVEVNGSWHIIKVIGRKLEPLGSVTASIRQSMLQSATSKITAALTALERRADVTVNPAYGRYVKAGQQTGVVPPVGPRQSLLTMPGPSWP